MAIERVPTCRLMVIERFSMLWVRVIERFSPHDPIVLTIVAPKKYIQGGSPAATKKFRGKWWNYRPSPPLCPQPSVPSCPFAYALLGL